MTHTFKQAFKQTFTQSFNGAALTSALLLSTAIALPTAALADTGYMTKTISVPHREAPVRLDIYYPAEAGGQTTLHGKNAVFTGIEISADGKPKAGKHPVVIFSHGSGGNGINTGWMGKALADQGIIMIAPNHPGTTSRDSHPEDTVKTWERPQDISSLIDQLPKLFAGDMQADTSRIGAVGFSLGGYSVLALAGAQISKAAFIEHCDRSMGKGLNECAWITKAGLHLNDTDQERFEQSNKDPRIATVVSIDPGLAAAFTPQSLKAMKRPVKIINLGSEGTIYAGVDGKPVAADIPNAKYHTVDKAWHFSFLGTCTPIGAEILIAEKDDPICDEKGGRDRADIHKEIANETVSFIKQHLAVTN